MVLVKDRKMTHGALSNCKKFVIQRIINPSAYWMTEYEKGKCHTRQMKLFECRLAKNAEKPKDDISLGMMIAIERDGNFCRGIIMDIFNRKAEMIYTVSLVDYGTIIETTEKNIYFIKSKELRSKQFSAFEVTIQGLQPSVLDVDYNKNFESGIFQKRVCNAWSQKAFNFVKQLVKDCPYVYVKIKHSNQRKLSGEIYLVQQSDTKPVSLGQLLCDKGFAILQRSEIKLKDDLQGNCTVVDEKIPKGALPKGIQKSEASQPKSQKGRTEFEKSSHSASLQRAFITSSQSSTYGTLEKENNPSTKPRGNHYSSSWMLKKCSLVHNLSPLNESLNEKDFI